MEAPPPPPAQPPFSAPSLKEAGGGGDDDLAPESWEMADLEESMKRLLAPSSSSSSSLVESGGSSGVILADAWSEDRAPSPSLPHVDSFLREALQNPRDRLFILRLEQDVIKFMRNPKQEQLEFPPMTSSYLRLAAHRVVQHYSLQSMVMDCANVVEGSRIIAFKTPGSRFPAVRLADIPCDGNLDTKVEVISPVQMAIKQRPQKGSMQAGGSGSNSAASKLNLAKTVEERKQEYNKARARIFSSDDLSAKATEEEPSFSRNRFPLNETRNTHESPERQDSFNSLADSKFDNISREPAQSIANKVAILRDREKEKNDPDYDRSYDRYARRFDPGFGLPATPYNMQALYTPMINYNTEFPQLGGPSRPQMHSQVSQVHTWIGGGSSNSTFSYGPPADSLMGSINPASLRGPFSGSHMYYRPAPCTVPLTAMTYIHPQEHLHPQDCIPQSLSQSYAQPEANSHARHR